MYSMADLYDSDYKKAVILDLDGNVVASGRVKFEYCMNEFVFDSMSYEEIVGSEIKVDSLPRVFSIEFLHDGENVRFDKVIFNSDIAITFYYTGSTMDCTFEIIGGCE